MTVYAQAIIECAYNHQHIIQGVTLQDGKFVLAVHDQRFSDYVSRPGRKRSISTCRVFFYRNGFKNMTNSIKNRATLLPVHTYWYHQDIKPGFTQSDLKQVVAAAAAKNQNRSSYVANTAVTQAQYEIYPCSLPSVWTQSAPTTGAAPSAMLRTAIMTGPPLEQPSTELSIVPYIPPLAPSQYSAHLNTGPTTVASSTISTSSVTINQFVTQASESSHTAIQSNYNNTTNILSLVSEHDTETGHNLYLELEIDETEMEYIDCTSKTPIDFDVNENDIDKNINMTSFKDETSIISQVQESQAMSNEEFFEYMKKGMDDASKTTAHF